MLRTKLMFCVLLLAIPAVSGEKEEEMPDWVLPGIMKVETQSFFKDGTIIYVDTRRGKSGERGPFQMTRVAFKQISDDGERFSDLETDMDFSQRLAVRYLWWVYREYGNGSWKKTVAIWNTGPHGYRHNRRKGDRYAEKVYSNGTTEVAENTQKSKEKGGKD